MPRWLIVVGVCGGLLMMLLVAVGAVFLITPDEQPTQESVQEEQPAQEERVAPNEAPEPVPEPEPEPAPEPPDSATILLSGDAAYHCTIGSVGGDRSVEGTPPQEYKVAVDTGPFDYERVWAYCYKSGTPGTLGVQIVYDGQMRQEATTSAEHGIASVSWSLRD